MSALSGYICVVHRLSSITPYSLHALFSIDDEADEFLRKGPPVGDFAAFRLPQGCSWTQLGSICEHLESTGKLPRGVRWL